MTVHLLILSFLVKRSITLRVEPEYWTEECLIDELTLRLASVTYPVAHADPVTNNLKTLTIHKYYHQASVLRKYIAAAQPTPSFVISVSDLTPEIIAQLQMVPYPQLILKQVVGRIFENLDFELYHLSIAKVLQVRLVE
jgi:hypothetical protein